MRQVIRTFVRQDGEQSLAIIKRDDGWFSFQEFNRIVDRAGDASWHPMRPGGLYETAAAAEREACSQIEWLTDAVQNSN